MDLILQRFSHSLFLPEQPAQQDLLVRPVREAHRDLLVVVVVRALQALPDQRDRPVPPVLMEVMVVQGLPGHPEVLVQLALAALLVLPDLQDLPGLTGHSVVRPLSTILRLAPLTVTPAQDCTDSTISVLKHLLR